MTLHDLPINIFSQFIYKTIIKYNLIVVVVVVNSCSTVH